MDKHQFRIIILACLAISGVLVFYILFSRKQTPQPQNLSYVPLIAKAQPSQVTTVESPDGKFTLAMKEEKGRETVHKFSISGDTPGDQEIFSKTASSNSTLSIPANAFSPDNKYVFLKEEEPAQTNYFVLTTSGAPIAKDAQTYDISSLFAAKYPNYKITDVTGWGAVNLIIVNVDKNEGGQGPSFWFDVGSKSFIRLTNRFN